MARRSRKKTSTVSVDFEGVESSGKIQEGRQIATVEEVELKDSESGFQYLNWKLKGEKGLVWHTTSLQPQALWNLRNVLEALGLEVEGSVMELDPADFAGMELGIEVEHETYQGKKRGIIVDVFPTSDLEDEDNEEEPEDEEEVDEEDAEEDEDSDEEEEEKPKRRSRKSKRKANVIKKGSTVTFEDEGEEITGKILSVNKKEGFAVVEVEDEEWEVELSDLE